MKVCLFIVSYIYAILQQIYVWFHLDLEINGILSKILADFYSRIFFVKNAQNILAL